MKKEPFLDHFAKKANLLVEKMQSDPEGKCLILIGSEDQGEQTAMVQRVFGKSSDLVQSLRGLLDDKENGNAFYYLLREAIIRSETKPWGDIEPKKID